MKAANSPTQLASLFKDYEQHHQTFGNKVCHYVGIPLIVLSLFGLLAGIDGGEGASSAQWLRPDGGLALWALAVLCYLVLDWKITIPFSLFALGLYFVGRAIPLPALWLTFVLGWVVQFVGHFVYEKQRPAFFKNVIHLLVGPLWIFARVVGYHHRSPAVRDAG